MPTPLEIFVTGGTGYIGQHPGAVGARASRARVGAPGVSQPRAGWHNDGGGRCIASRFGHGRDTARGYGRAFGRHAASDSEQGRSVRKSGSGVNPGYGERSEASGDFSSDLPECRSAGADYAGLPVGARARRVDDS